MSVRAKVYGFMAAIVLIAGGGYFFSTYTVDGLSVQAKSAKSEQEKKEKEEEEKATPIETESAITGSISDHVASTANLRALRSVQLMNQLQGVVRQVLAEEGDFVQTGQTLVRLDDRELLITQEVTKQQLAQAEAQLAGAKILRDKMKTQIKNKQADLARNEQALKEGLVSDTDVDLIRYQLDELVHDEEAQAATVRQNTSRVEELGSEIARVDYQLSQTRITAPFAGRVTERTVEVGQTLRANDALFRLGAFSPLFADVFLSEQDSRRVSPGQPATLMLGSDTERRSEAKIVRVSPVVDDATGTVKVTAELRGGDSDFRPGAFVRVSIRTDTRDETTLIPKRAVLEEDGRTFVFVHAGETATRREVKLGYEDGPAVEALEGVKPGDEVVVAGQGSLKEGDKVRLVSG